MRNLDEEQAMDTEWADMHVVFLMYWERDTTVQGIDIFLKKTA